VDKAIAGGVKLPSFVAVDGWHSAHVLCRECFDEATKTIEDPCRPKGYDISLGDGVLVVGCDKCLSDWFRATNGGNLDSIIGEARRKAELPPRRHS
jgi:hypothetical protein